MGIFGADGQDWHEARALLRPSFAKGEMNDTHRFETHCRGFLQVLPADGVAIDLHGLLSRLSMDTATDLLFGRSTGSLLDFGGLGSGKVLLSRRHRSPGGIL